MRIYRFYQLDFLTPEHPFNLLFSGNSRGHVTGGLEIKEPVDVVLFGETFDCLVFMRVDLEVVNGFAGFDHCVSSKVPITILL